ncbi:phage head-tail joining family protein [Collimonas pratensis]|uniref:Phage head-tail joining family protein n=1 Tax=Collimonas pratensis TaxID=279113 RepID=A0ABN4MB71_9BURK|nr:phage head-tail joining family protein [Collimonas pratensis]
MGKPYAKKEDLSGRELFAAQAAQSEVTTRFRIRYRTGVTAKMRLLCDGVIYNIEAVLDRDGRKRELQLMCSSGLNNG